MSTKTGHTPSRKKVKTKVPRQSTAGEVTGIIGFDYSTVPAKVAADAKEVAARIKARLSNSVIKTGGDLLTIKEKLDHGQFGPWLRGEFQWSERTAQRYMDAAQLVAKNQILSELPPTALYALAAPATPASVKKAVINDLKDGERLGAKDVAALIREAKGESTRASIPAQASPTDPVRESSSHGVAEARAIIKLGPVTRADIIGKRKQAAGDVFWVKLKRRGGYLYACKLRAAAPPKA